MPFPRRFATCLCLFFIALALPGPRIARAQDPAPNALFYPLPAPRPLPALIVKTGPHSETTLADLVRARFPQNRRVFLHLWAPFCRFCAKEMQQLDPLMPALKAQGVELINIAEDENAFVTVPNFIRRMGMRFLETAYDPSRQGLLKLGASGIPTTYALDQQGRIVAVHEGIVDWSAFLR